MSFLEKDLKYFFGVNIKEERNSRKISISILSSPLCTSVVYRILYRMMMVLLCVCLRHWFFFTLRTFLYHLSPIKPTIHPSIVLLLLPLTVTDIKLLFVCLFWVNITKFILRTRVFAMCICIHTHLHSIVSRRRESLYFLFLLLNYA